MKLPKYGRAGRKLCRLFYRTEFQARPLACNLVSTYPSWGFVGKHAAGNGSSIQNILARSRVHSLVRASKTTSVPHFNHFAARRYFRLTPNLGLPRILGFTSGRRLSISADILFGQRFWEDLTRTVADVNIKTFRQRSLATPVHDYIPLLAAGERLLLTAAAPVLFILRPLGLSSWLDSLYEAEAHARNLRDTEVGYCKKLLADLHQRLDAGDTTPSQMGDLFRSIEDGTLTPNEELRLATTLVSSGMASGTSLTWLAGYLAAHPEMQEKAYRAIEEVYGDQNPDPLDTDRVDSQMASPSQNRRSYGITVIRNGDWALPEGIPWRNRDPQRYDLPEEFLPERWMDGHYGRTDVKQPKVGVPHLNHGAGRRGCMGVPNVNKMLYANLVLLLHFYKLERGPLGDDARASVFPELRAVGEAGLEMHPVDDQVSACDAQAVPLAAGIKLTPRDPDALARWLAEGHRKLDQWERPNPANASLSGATVDPESRGRC
ncbi:cytochrome P450 [Mycena vitilis]|nr:cytochrome P450 [Mycena vitilis]